MNSNPPSPESYENLMHPDDRRTARVLTHLNEGTETDKGSEYRIIRASDGAVRCVSTRYGVLYTEDGQESQYFGVIQDITERKAIEDNLAHAQAIAKVGNFTWNLITNEAVCSDEVCRIYGIESNTVNYHELHGLTHPNDKERQLNAINRALSDKDRPLDDVEIRIVRRDGTERYVQIYGTCTFNESGKPIMIFGTVQDITERKETEELLRRTDKLSIVGKLAAGVAHEIRNPLMTLKGFVQFLRTMNQSEEQQKRYCDIMLDELRQIEFIASEMLVLASPQVKDVANRNIVSKLREVVTLLQSQALLHNVEILLDVQSDDIQVKSEPGRLKQVFVNLIKNAIDAMPKGGILNISAFQKAQQVCIIFYDTGCGISPERMSKIGEPFYTTKEKGTGLGLMVSNKIVQDHLGTLEIESTLGVGTTVTVTLPSC